VNNVRLELDELSGTWNEAVQDQAAIADLRKQLKAVNEALWEIEDDIRDQEAAQNFGQKFIELARAVYVTNDKRAAIKKEVNLALGSRFVEEKSYQEIAEILDLPLGTVKAHIFRARELLYKYLKEKKGTF
jgi:DNA-directed RNA polymerase specialized sigma24 family protein